MGDGADDALDRAIYEMLEYAQGGSLAGYAEDYDWAPPTRSSRLPVASRDAIRVRAKIKYPGEESGE